MSYLYNAYKVVEGETLDENDTFLSNPLDLRFGGGAHQRIGRIVGIGLYHNAAVATQVTLQYVWGIQDAQYEPAVLSSIYQAKTANDALINNQSLAPGVLHVVPAPMVLMPFVRFWISIANGSVPGVYQLWAYCSERYQ